MNMNELLGSEFQRSLPVHLRQADVVEEPTSDAVTIRFGGTDIADNITGVRYLAGADVSLGSVVWVLQSGGVLVVLGKVAPGVGGGNGGGGVTDHGALTGLQDDDHPQYALGDHDHGGVYSPEEHDHPHNHDVDIETAILSHEAEGDPHAGYVQEGLLDAAGDLIVADFPGSPIRLPVGTEGQVLTADPAEIPRMKWADPTGGGVAIPQQDDPPASPAEDDLWIDTDEDISAINGGVIVCTSTTRPIDPSFGTQIFETDTGIMYVWTGTAWRELSAPRYAARLYRSTNLAVTGGFASTVIPFNALHWADDDIVFQGGANYTCPIAGLYRVTVNIQLDGSEWSAPAIRIGGSNAGEGGRTQNPGRSVGHNMTAMGSAAAGAVIDASIWNDGGAATSIREGSAFTWMLVERIGPRHDSGAAL